MTCWAWVRIFDASWSESKNAIDAIVGRVQNKQVESTYRAMLNETFLATHIATSDATWNMMTEATTKKKRNRR